MTTKLVQVLVNTDGLRAGQVGELDAARADALCAVGRAVAVEDVPADAAPSADEAPPDVDPPADGEGDGEDGEAKPKRGRTSGAS